jgi:aspartyl-tRNA(Asn)/glutamyl-tRNA(Gln) amidotransferase subunit B
VDLNRTGTPLLEIVTRPDLNSPEEAKAFLEEIRLLLREIGVSDCEMQEGSLRCDANVNIQIPLDLKGTTVYSTIVEVKNLNSFRAVERATKYEADRQFQDMLIYPTLLDFLHSHGLTWETLFREGRPVQPDLSQYAAEQAMKKPKATAGWDEDRGVTRVQRRKEEAADYRYFPEPDLAPVTVDAATLERARAEVGEVPAAARARLQTQYGLSAYDAGVLTGQGRALVAYFEAVATACGDAKAASNWVTNKVLATLKEKADVVNFSISAAALAELIKEQKSVPLNKQTAEEVYGRMLATGGTAKEAIAALGIKAVDSGALAEVVRRAIAANPKAVADFKKGKAAAAQAIKGAVMKETKGTAKPDMVHQILMEELQKA